jgi:hypothetical protein
MYCSRNSKDLSNALKEKSDGKPTNETKVCGRSRNHRRPGSLQTTPQAPTTGARKEKVEFSITAASGILSTLTRLLPANDQRLERNHRQFGPD